MCGNAGKDSHTKLPACSAHSFLGTAADYLEDSVCLSFFYICITFAEGTTFCGFGLPIPGCLKKGCSLPTSTSAVLACPLPCPGTLNVSSPLQCYNNEFVNWRQWCCQQIFAWSVPTLAITLIEQVHEPSIALHTSEYEFFCACMLWYL